MKFKSNYYALVRRPQDTSLQLFNYISSKEIRCSLYPRYTQAKMQSRRYYNLFGNNARYYYADELIMILVTSQSIFVQPQRSPATFFMFRR